MRITQQLVLTGLVLCVFALFHHVLPRYMGKAAEPIAIIPYVRETAAPSAQSAEQPMGPEAPEETPVPGPFTAGRIEGEDSFSSPSLVFTITKYEHTEAHPAQCYYVADVYIRDVEQLSIAFPISGYLYGDPYRIAEGAGAVLAINSDNASALGEVFTVRNGALYNGNSTRGDICVLFRDGSMKTYAPNTYTNEEILAAEPWQVWCFGPSLLDENGQPLEEFNIDRTLQNRHPRTVIGYYEPGHYCFVVIDGRGGEYSKGTTIKETAQIMAELGCRCAYNLDGGASTLMLYRNELVNVPSRDRSLKEMIVLREREETANEAS
ncbi:MAG: phosphodiester glycosidase family protein [Oscillospiraceae bacterium]|nr:phosphodiester glycosidase family protein [Oscillospiraceae bacterium]